MTTHFIFMSSSYSQGTRIAMDYIIDKDEKRIELNKKIEKIIEECGKDVSISTHMIQTENESWESVIQADHFFKNVKIITNINEFIETINIDRNLQGIDVAKYVLSKFTCTQLKLQKLVYLCFADYLCNTEKELFSDEIYAFKYGPVVDSVYKNYKKYGYNAIEKEDVEIDSKNIFEMPSRSRILFAEDGVEKIQSIEESLRKYGEMTATQLVDLTHKKDTPWSKSLKNTDKVFSKISLDIIKKYHKFEKGI